MEIEGVGAKTAMVINQVVNVLIAFGIAVFYYDGAVNVTCATVVYFALLNFWDAAFAWMFSKFKRGEE